MKIRRIRLVLPPRMRGSAQGDARAIADTLASALAMIGADARGQPSSSSRRMSTISASG